MTHRGAKAVAETAIMRNAESAAKDTGRMKMLRLNDFLKVLDTQERVMVYLDGCEDKAYATNEMPEWYKDLELTDVYVDDEGLGVAIYTA
jgi:hypothetical protein